MHSPGATQESPTTKKAARVRITQGPELESARPNLVIIRWTSNNPGGSPEHYGVVHYGTNPKDLSQTAKSPIRLNPVHSYTVFRVRMDDLPPRTKYYYKVDSMGPNGKSDGVKSPVKRAFLKIQEEFGSFDSYCRRFVNGRPKLNRWKSMRQIPPTSPESDAFSRDLKHRGFSFVGSTVVYAHMQAVGMVNDHLVECFRYRKIQRGRS